MKRILFWLSFIVVLALIIWGLVVAMNKPVQVKSRLGIPAPVTATDHITGNKSASTTVMIYEDFQCPACAIYYPYIERLLNESSSTIRIVFRHFPLPQHNTAMPAALAAEAAGAQGKFWEMYSKLYENQNDWAENSKAESIFEGYATDLGLNLAKFKTDEASTGLKDFISNQKIEGEQIGIDHTPTFLLNNKEITPNSYDQFKKLVDEAVKGSSN